MLNGNQTLTLEGFDFFKLENFLSDKQRETRDKVRAYVHEAILPNINAYWDKAEFPRDLAMGLKDLGIIGGVIRGFESAGLDPLCLCLVMYKHDTYEGAVLSSY